MQPKRDVSMPTNFDYTALQKSLAFEDYLYEIRRNKGQLLSIIFLTLVVVATTIAGIAIGEARFVLFSILLGSVLAWIVWANAKEQAQLRQFVAANQLVYIDAQFSTSAFQGVIFGKGHSRHFVSGLTSVSQDWLVANYQYTVGSGKNSRTFDYGLIRIQLPRKLPNVLFDAKKNNFIVSNLESNVNPDQKIVLEGDFNNYFTVYGPSGYGRDILYFLTPELMSCLVDHAAGYDIEIIDDQLFLYSVSPFMFQSKRLKSTLETISQVANRLSTEFADNTKRYADERVLQAQLINEVAPQGRRLKTGRMKLSTWIIIAVIMLWFFWDAIQALLSSY